MDTNNFIQENFTGDEFEASVFWGCCEDVLESESNNYSSSGEMAVYFFNPEWLYMSQNLN